jgi:hypothetical protein
MESCSICLCRLGRKKYISSCNHKYHYKCILLWLINNDTCPNCRTVIRDVDEEIEISDEEIGDMRRFFFFLARVVEMRL